MGNFMTTAGRFMTRKMKRYNVENRALKFIDQDKMPIAPKHPSTVEMLESITKDPKVREELIRKNTDLDENLKHVYVKSLHKPVTNDDEKERLRSRKLPQERSYVPDLKFGHTEPTVVPKGKYSLSQVIDMLTDHATDPMVHTPQVLAEKYSLDVKLVESLIMYFKMFKIERATEEDAQRVTARKIMSTFALEQIGRAEKETMFEMAFSNENTDTKGLKSPKGGAISRPVISDEGQLNRTVLPNEEEQYQEPEGDSVYKNVANKIKKKKKTGP
ncbi:hypothetical protein M8J76_012542 [Diaphorina citri]|nr:hypothetical protein M8J76_012542 [Diaphorina citri]